MLQPEEEGEHADHAGGDQRAPAHDRDRLAELRRNILGWLAELEPELRRRVEERIARNERIPAELFRASMLYRDAALRAYLEVIGTYPNVEQADTR